MISSEYDLCWLVEQWEPSKERRCSDCGDCRVSGTPAQPAVYCAAGHDGGQAQSLWRVIRRRNPRGFRAAGRCPDFVSMDDA